MDFIFHQKENVIITSQHNPKVPTNKDIYLSDINMESKEAVLNERDRIVNLMGEYNYFQTPRAPFDFNDYGFERKKQYIKDKEDWRLNYVKERSELSEIARKLEQQITYLCRKQKAIEDKEAIKEGTFYNADELAVLGEMVGDKKARRNKQLQRASTKYYDKNKEKIQIKRKLKVLENELTNLENKEHHLKLVKSNTIIKPLCLCGCAVNIIKLKDITAHSNIIKHSLFKSIIKLVHFKRRQRRIINVVREVNKSLADGRRQERFKKEDGKWGTRLCRTNTDTLNYFNAQCDPYDESVAPKKRKSTQEKKNYTSNYKDNRLLLANQITAKLGRPKED